ncbi:Rpn family recombination-promoting nuclease/putative transposase [Cupriavidus gilardii]|uniref:Rpn family recombination-promoting nuclease/putative transposase n=1 Tax=Cupriavidus gilardii TaxID=82541 RepID=UPI001ABECC92|nr:Rpn family recombination-promoting nuclease/putative transposase [Cupriavidus gilardii]MBO4119542.1 Rpn family recombination-promoting nuclease/putative transposase [Cupriavidus gilardii]
MLDYSACQSRPRAPRHSARNAVDRHTAGHAGRYPLYGPVGYPTGHSRIPPDHDGLDVGLPWRLPGATCLNVCEPDEEANAYMPRTPARHHDASYKLVFAFREVVRDLIRDFIADPWLQTADFDSMELVPTHHVSDGLRVGMNDVVWRLRVPDQEQPVHLLIEFQSSNDPHMAARMLAYVGMFYRDASRRCRGTGRRRYPLVFPIVFYNGTARWRAPTDIAAMIPRVPGCVAAYQPSQQYWLIDRAAYTESELATQRNLVAALMRLEQATTVDAVFAPLRLARELAQGNAALDTALTAWIAARAANFSAAALDLNEVHNLMELDMELSEGYGKWARRLERDITRKVKAKVRAEVKAEVKAELLITQLDHRFGPLAEDITAKVLSASVEQIEDWARRVLYAQRLDEVFLC